MESADEDKTVIWNATRKGYVTKSKKVGFGIIFKNDIGS